ncbi:MBL fold metallo-hydrolase [Microseira wollei]|uniref:Beta-lactamase-like protein n=1 Tax=Microseira wollei NIES-4236 TaxID=2530354 RepID=A0AAV3X6L9_9CYAN|nr:MBL fold metallo-hydrolase [Microseira wollei]GET35857.1 beta-lactamase-like protein [Microseira wollei NIES-4236]
MPKPARAVFDNIFAFPPNRETLGATAYFIVKNDVNILLDCPAPDEENQLFLQERGGVRWLFITHRGGIGKHVKEIQQTFGCEILIQEQEAYLLPGLTVTTFQKEFTLSPTSQVIWTPGHSPGSSCLYDGESGGVLFTGRHLLPNRQGNPVPLRTSKTFHWRRQINSVNMLREVFSSETLQYICPGANTGFLRGKGAIAKAYDKLAQLNLDALLQAKPGL